MAWRKSARSNGKGNCVEVAAARSVVAVRDSKDTAGPMLTFDLNEWRTFVGIIKTDTPS
ncbi:DUF397 domain-containing protein [Actinomadura rubrisoli]|uniref:DUF397 domain-containing protein n=1 Tax=Actinomadura rubrisoli TaxID=2530368 RepID=UPI00312C74DB